MASSGDAVRMMKGRGVVGCVVVVAAGLSLLGSFVAANAASAQAPAHRAAILVRGEGVEAARVREPVHGALTALGYEVLAADAVAAAAAFVAAGDDEALRRSLATDTMVVVETRAAPDGEVFVSVTRLSDAGRQQQFGRTTADAAGTFAVTQLVEWTRAAQAAPPPVAADPAAPRVVPLVTAQPAVVTPAPTAVAASRSEPDEQALHPGAGLILAGAVPMILGIVGYLLTPIFGGTVLCHYRYPNCEDQAALGLIPFAGPWLLLDSPVPGHPWDEGQQALLFTFGIAQTVLLPVGIVLFAIGATRRAPPPIATVGGISLDVDVAPAPGGGLLVARGSF